MKVSPMVVLILGLLLAFGGVSASMTAQSPAEKVGTALPGLIVVTIAVVMSYRQSRAKRAARDEAERDIGDIDKS